MGRTSVTVLILLFLFSLTTCYAVAASAESFDNCQPRQPFKVLALMTLPFLLWGSGHFKNPWEVQPPMDIIILKCSAFPNYFVFP